MRCEIPAHPIFNCVSRGFDHCFGPERTLARNFYLGILLLELCRAVVSRYGYAVTFQYCKLQCPVKRGAGWKGASRLRQCVANTMR